MQMNTFLNKLMGEEDCLFLNLYTPKVPSSEDFEGYPVLVWIHGGAFFLVSTYIQLKPKLVNTVHCSCRDQQMNTEGIFS